MLVFPERLEMQVMKFVSIFFPLHFENILGCKVWDSLWPVKAIAFVWCYAEK